jgi:hypothetical protein
MVFFMGFPGPQALNDRAGKARTLRYPDFDEETRGREGRDPRIAIAGPKRLG